MSIANFDIIASASSGAAHGLAGLDCVLGTEDGSSGAGLGVVTATAGRAADLSVVPVLVGGAAGLLTGAVLSAIAGSRAGTANHASGGEGVSRALGADAGAEFCDVTRTVGSTADEAGIAVYVGRAAGAVTLAGLLGVAGAGGGAADGAIEVAVGRAGAAGASAVLAGVAGATGFTADKAAVAELVHALAGGADGVLAGVGAQHGGTVSVNLALVGPNGAALAGEVRLDGLQIPGHLLALEHLNVRDGTQIAEAELTEVGRSVSISSDKLQLVVTAFVDARSRGAITRVN
jgi:hypothetical protein